MKIDSKIKEVGLKNVVGSIKKVKYKKLIKKYYFYRFLYTGLAGVYTDALTKFNDKLNFIILWIDKFLAVCYNRNVKRKNIKNNNI